jgi:hypothetical protein
LKFIPIIRVSKMRFLKNESMEQNSKVIISSIVCCIDMNVYVWMENVPNVPFLSH